MAKPCKVSIILPSRGERFMAQTVNDLLKNARGDIQVIVGLDGYWPEPYVDKDGRSHEVDWHDKRVHALHFGKAQGMRQVINAAAQIADGEFLMKLDAHCSVSEGFDIIMQEEVDKYTVAVPRRYSLDAENWCWKTDHGKPPVDYHYLSWPYEDTRKGVGLHGTVWTQRAKSRLHIPIDDEMSSQGSCWFMQKKHFMHRLNPMEVERYGSFIQEFQEIGLKTWLGGGRVIINKKAWYAHLHKGKEYGRGYFISKGELSRGANEAVDHWMFDRWVHRKRDIKWLIDHFAPVPTWPADWPEQLGRVQAGELKYAG